MARNPADAAGQTELGLALLFANRVADAVAPLHRATVLAPKRGLPISTWRSRSSAWPGTEAIVTPCPGR